MYKRQTSGGPGPTRRCTYRKTQTEAYVSCSAPDLVQIILVGGHHHICGIAAGVVVATAVALLYTKYMPAMSCENLRLETRRRNPARDTAIVIMTVTTLSAGTHGYIDANWRVLEASKSNDKLRRSRTTNCCILGHIFTRAVQGSNHILNLTGRVGSGRVESSDGVTRSDLNREKLMLSTSDSGRADPCREMLNTSDLT